LNCVVRCSVEQEFVAAVLAAVDRPVGDGTVVERALERRLAVVGDSGRERRQGERIPRRQRQLGQPSVVDEHAAIAPRRLQQLGVRGNDDALREVADLQQEVDGEGLTHLEAYVACVCPEPRHGGGNDVVVRPQERQRVCATRAGDYRRDLIRPDVGGGDSRTWDRQAGGIRDAAGDARTKLLSGRRARGGEQRQRKEKRRHYGPPRTGIP
jgi:hypothetical protein